MTNIKHQINIGNCGNDINTDLVSLPVIPQNVRWDSTIIKFDSTIITFDQT